MLIFRSIQKYFAIAGINSYQSLQVHPFNTRNLIIFSIYGLCTVSNVIYFLYVANNFTEYADIIYRISTLTMCAVIYAILVSKMDKIFEIFDTLESVIDKSKSKFKDLYHIPYHSNKKKSNFLGLIYPDSERIYRNTNQTVEKWCQFLHLAGVKGSSTAILMFTILIGYGRYFATDLGNDAFELVFPTWLACILDTRTQVSMLENFQ